MKSFFEKAGLWHIVYLNLQGILSQFISRFWCIVRKQCHIEHLCLFSAFRLSSIFCASKIPYQEHKRTQGLIAKESENIIRQCCFISCSLELLEDYCAKRNSIIRNSLLMFCYNGRKQVSACENDGWNITKVKLAELKNNMKLQVSLFLPLVSLFVPLTLICWIHWPLWSYIGLLECMIYPSLDILQTSAYGPYSNLKHYPDLSTCCDCTVFNYCNHIRITWIT